METTPANLPDARDVADLLAAAKNAALVISSIYESLEKIDRLGGAASISGIAACHSMLASLRKNEPRVDALVMQPLLAGIAKIEGQK
jgi:hypothetical protein